MELTVLGSACRAQPACRAAADETPLVAVRDSRGGCVLVSRPYLARRTPAVASYWVAPARFTSSAHPGPAAGAVHLDPPPPPRRLSALQLAVARPDIPPVQPAPSRTTASSRSASSRTARIEAHKERPALLRRPPWSRPTRSPRTSSARSALYSGVCSSCLSWCVVPLPCPLERMLTLGPPTVEVLAAQGHGRAFDGDDVLVVHLRHLARCLLVRHFSLSLAQDREPHGRETRELEDSAQPWLSSRSYTSDLSIPLIIQCVARATSSMLVLRRALTPALFCATGRSSSRSSRRSLGPSACTTTRATARSRHGSLQASH